jgi:hypothetical protein
MAQSEAVHAAVIGGTPPVPRARRSHRLPVLLLLAAGLATGAACGGSGSGSGDGVASIKTASDTKTDSDTADKKDKDKTNPEDAMLEFARCMREHGVDMPDPDTSGGGPGVVTFSASASAGTKLDADTNKFQEANDACKDLLGDVGPMNMSPEQQQEMQDQALAFSRCMREHGVNMPDPTFGSEGQMMMTIGDGNGIDPTDPKFEEAQQACGSAFGPAGAKPGAGLSVAGGGKGDGVKGPGGVMVFGGGAVGSSSGGAK